MTDDLDPIRKDRALQVDPELNLSDGRAGGAQIATTMLAAFGFIVLLIYGLNHQRDETATTEPTQTTAQAPADQQAQGQPNQQGQGQNQPAQAALVQNARQGETTGSGAASKPGAAQTRPGDSSQQGAPAQAK